MADKDEWLRSNQERIAREKAREEVKESGISDRDSLNNEQEAEPDSESADRWDRALRQADEMKFPGPYESVAVDCNLEEIDEEPDE